MNITTDRMHLVFRNEKNGKVFYAIGVSKKRQDGSYENAFIPVQFKKNVNLENQTNIYIKEAWLSFYKTKDNKSVFYIFINDYETVEQVAHKEYEYSSITTNEIPEEMTITDDDLPF